MLPILAFGIGVSSLDVVSWDCNRSFDYCTIKLSFCHC